MLTQGGILLMARNCTVNQDACIGCGMCMSFAEAVLAFNGDGKVENVLGEIPEDLEAAVEEAAASCPVQAIEVE